MSDELQKKREKMPSAAEENRVLSRENVVAMPTRQNQVIDTIRSWAITGKIPANKKVSEAELAEALGVSRTPVRHALAILVEEGLLTRVGARGYAVRTYVIDDVLDAISIRGMVEGYAARKLAIAGLNQELRNALKECLVEGDNIFAKGTFIEADEARYARMNKRFHALATESAGSDLLRHVGSVINRIPFGSPGAIAFDRMDAQQRFSTLQYAHHQHHFIVDALIERDGARVEALFREHAGTIKKSLGLGAESVEAQSNLEWILPFEHNPSAEKAKKKNS